MNFDVKDVLNVGGMRYVTLSVLNYDNVKYGLMNRIDDEEEPTNEYLIFYTENGELKSLKDRALFSILISKFQEILKKEMDNVVNG